MKFNSATRDYRGRPPRYRLLPSLTERIDTGDKKVSERIDALDTKLTERISAVEHELVEVKIGLARLEGPPRRLLSVH